MNTPEWIKFIGDRNVPTLEATEKYILNIENNPLAKYWVVVQTETQQCMGIITFLKRIYLDHWDIGFAFLPRFTGNGFASEAAGVILKEMTMGGDSTILASALKENVSSIKLLKRLGFQFSKEIMVENEILQLYSVSEMQFRLQDSIMH